jgi:hypothetical protein
VTTDTVTANDGKAFGGSAPLVVAAAVGFAAAIGFLLVRPPRTGMRSAGTDRSEALADYLRDHLAGSDAALQLVGRLRQRHAGTEAGGLFASLAEDFAEERQAVRELLASLGHSAHAAKRVPGVASGGVLALSAGGDTGDISLYRAVEGLAIGVQGKRLLWRTLQSLGLTHPASEGRSLADFEAMAVRQWEAIEHYRLTLGPVTFPASHGEGEPRAAAAGRA